MNKPYTAEHLAFLRTHYPRLSRVELTDCFNAEFGMSKSVEQITSTIKNHKIQSGRTNQFRPGNVPFNAGTRGVMKRNSGTFNTGNVPANQQDIGYERIDADGYVWVKVAEPNPYTKASTRFRQKHRLVWESVGRPIPKNHVIVFLDGNRQNCDLDNLRCVPRGVLQWMNKTGLSDTQGEARKSAILTAEVFTVANTRARA